MSRGPNSARGKAPTLHPDRILAEADRLAREHGWGTVSMRQLAGELGVSPMALYWHFENRSELGRALIERAFSSLLVPQVKEKHWREALFALVDALHQHCEQHAHVLPLLSSPQNWPNSLAIWSNRLLRTLSDQGLTQPQVLAAHSLLMNRALMPGLYLNPRGDTLAPGLRAAIEKPPGGDADRLIELLPKFETDLAKRFEGDMALLLDGLQRQIETRDG